MIDEITQQIPQRRLFTRIPFEADYYLHDASSGESWSGAVLDISLKGALVLCPHQFTASVDDEFVLELEVKDKDLKVVMLASIAHTSDGFIGFRCHHIETENELILRKILETDLERPEFANRDITEMLNNIAA